MKRCGSQSSSSSHSAPWTEKNEFPSYEDLFYRPPIPEARNCSPKIVNGLLSDDENEGPIRALLDEMHDWYIDQSEESESRLYKPLPPPPVEESDDEDAIRKPFGDARVLLRAVESTEQLQAIAPTPPLRLKTSIPPTPSTVSPGPKTPTMFPVPSRPYADVPQSPISEAFVDPPIPSTPLQSSIRARSSSLPLCPPLSMKAVCSGMNFRRPPPLKPSTNLLGGAQDHVLLHPGFNKSFSAPSTPTGMEFMQGQAERRPHLLHVCHSPYSNTLNYLAPVDSRLNVATYSRWSLSTTAQDDNTPSTPLSPSTPNVSRRGLPRSPSRLGLGLGLSFTKFGLTKFVRLPSRGSSKKRLIIRGVASGEEIAVQGIRNWCEVFGTVDRVSQKSNGDIHVHFRNRILADRVCRAHTNVTIPGVGAVTLAYGSTK